METFRAGEGWEKEMTVELAEYRAEKVEKAEPKIRFGRFSDMEGLLELGRQFHEYAELGKWGMGYERVLFADVLVGFMTNENCCLIVADVEGKVVGTIAGMTIPWFMDIRQINAQEMWWYVDPEFRGTVGPELLNWFELWAKKRGAKVICLAGFYEKRLAALERLYGRRGYKPMEVHFVKEL